MGSIKPHYKFCQIEEKPKPFTEATLTSIADTQHQRENIMSSQMAVINQTRWGPRWETDWTH